MHPAKSTLLAVSAMIAYAGPAALAEFPLTPGLAPVALAYTCPKQNGSQPPTPTPFTMPGNQHLQKQNMSGAATPIAPNAQGTFATGQASLTIVTQLDSEAQIPNVIGPNYALANTAVWFFNTPTTLATTKVPIVMNNGGPVLMQGYVLDK